LIQGIGVDVTSVERIERVWRRSGARFARHVLADAERAQLPGVPDAARWLAKRWAAKEALAKAAGTGMRAPLKWGAIAVCHDPLGRPHFELSPLVRAWLARRGIDAYHLSISDEREIVVAMVVLESTPGSTHVA
jgi:holo-[acyl-carrier protein] synthase